MGRWLLSKIRAANKSKQQAAKEIGIGARAVYRYTSEHKEYLPDTIAIIKIVWWIAKVENRDPLGVWVEVWPIICSTWKDKNKEK